MKKIFTLLAGTVIVAAPVLADDSFVAPPYPAAESWVAYVFDRNYERVATQVIIPKSDMPEFASPVELTSIGVQVQPQESVTNPYHARIWIAQTDRDSFTARDASQLVPEDELVLVWEGEFLFEKSTETKDYVFQFNNPFPYDPTKNLVVTVSNNGEDGAPTPWIRGFNTVDADNNRINRMMYAKTWQTPDDFTLYNCKSDNKFVRALCFWLDEEEPKLKDYYSLLGADRIRALSCDEANLRREVAAINKEGRVEINLKKILKAGQRITKAQLKVLIQQQYNLLGIKKTAKATDIAKFGFDTKEVKIKEGGRYINGVELYERRKF